MHLLLLARALSPAALAQEPAASWSPLRVYIECQSDARIDACTFLRASVNGSEVLTASPRSDDQVTVYLNVTTQALDDRVSLRFVSALPDTPATYTLTEAVDSRATTDEQIAQLERLLFRGLSVYLNQSNPAAVTIALAAPTASTEAEAEGTPWGFGLWLGGWTSWSENYRSTDVWGGLYGDRQTETSRLGASVSSSYDYGRQPSLEVGGSSIDLVSASYDLESALFVERHLDERWSLGGMARAGHQDPEGPFLHTTRIHAGVSRDWFPSDDPRGNQLAVAYLAGVQADAYNQMNALGQEEALFASHMLLATGEVRFDYAELGLDLAAQAQLLAPLDRNVLAADARADLNLGDHVDLEFSMGITRQAIPGPLDIDTSNYEEVTRTSYAEPLAIEGFLNLKLHWDPTNGVRNNRFEVAGQLGALDNL